MGVPIIYQGSKYAPVPFVPIPPDVGPAPQFVSAEIGAVNAFTLVVTFDQDVSASNYALGVTIKVNGVATSISGGIRQANHAVVYYGIPVLWHGSGDAVTWEYNSAVGIIVAESGGAALGDVSAQSVTNNCEYAALLDLQADTLALADGDPVSTWVDQSGNGRDFAQTGIARPTKRTDGNGKSYLLFDGVDDSLIGGNFIDNPSNMAVFLVINQDIGYLANQPILTKISNTNAIGWACLYGTVTLFLQDNADTINFYNSNTNPGELKVLTFTMTARDVSNMHAYLNGNNSGETSFGPTSVGSITNNITVKIGTVDDPLGAGDGFYMGNIYTIVVCTPVMSAANRAALETRIGARYGITVP